MLVTVPNCSSGDTISFTADLAKLNDVVIIIPTNASLTIVDVTASQYISAGVFTVPSSPTYAGDNFDLLAVGPPLGNGLPPVTQ